MNILKDQPLVEAGFYRRAFNHLEFQKVLDSLSSGARSYRFFRLEITGNHVIVTPRPCAELYRATVWLSSQLQDPDQSAKLLAVTKERRFNLRHPKALLCHLHLDLFVAMDAYSELDLKKQQTSKNPEDSPAPAQTALQEYLILDSGLEDVERKVRHITAVGARSNIHTFNKNSVLVCLDGSMESRHLSLLTSEQLSCVQNLPGLRFIELPEDADPARLSQFLLEAADALSRVTLRYPALLDHSIGLKLRKIRHTLRQGMYIPATTTIVLDPRATDSLWHELGHWTHNKLMPELRSTSECEAFADNFRASFSMEPMDAMFCVVPPW